MNRKIIKQGHNTLTITLPSKFVKQFNLKPGSEVEILDKDNGLFLTTQKTGDMRTTEFSVSGLDIPTIWKYFMSVYREGYDEVKIKFNPDEKIENPYRFFTHYAVDSEYGKDRRKLSMYDAIEKINNRFIGFEIVEREESYVIVKDMSMSTSKEFENSLRRIFLILQEMADDTLESVKTHNSKLVESMHDIDISLDKFHDYCIRVLNKTGYKDSQKTSLLFSTLFLLELVGDEFKDVASHLLYDFPKEKFKNLVEVSENVREQIYLLYELFYRFDKEKILKISEIDNRSYNSLFPLKHKRATAEEKGIFNHLRRISRYINSLTELRIEMEV